MPRYSLDPTDSGFVNWQIFISRDERLIITLDGVEQRYVVTADEEAGSIDRLALDAQGQPVFNSESGKFERETLTGAVIVTPLKREF